MTGLEWVLAVLVLAVGSTLQGSVGFGSGLVAAPFILLLDDRLVPGAVLVPAMVLNLLVVFRDRRSMNISHVGDALLGRIPGTVAGTIAVAWLSRRGLSAVLGVSVIAACVVYWRGYSITRTRTTSVGAGFLSGFGATATAVGGPPMALLHVNDGGPQLRGTLSGFFAVGTVLSIVALTIGGQFEMFDLRWGVALLPGTFLGFLVSGQLTGRLDAGRLRTAVLLAAGTGGVLALARAILG